MEALYENEGIQLIQSIIPSFCGFWQLIWLSGTNKTGQWQWSMFVSVCLGFHPPAVGAARLKVNIKIETYAHEQEL